MRNGPVGGRRQAAGSLRQEAARGEHAGKNSGSRPAGRQSVAAARKSTGGSNRTQLIIGGIAVLVIGAIIVFGLVLNKQQTAVQAEGYGASTQSVATESATAS